MSSPAVFIATAKVRPGSEVDFTAWKGRHDALLAKFPGYISSDIMPPDQHSDMWTMVLNFNSSAELNAWQQSKERAGVMSELLPLVTGGNIGEEAPDSAQPATNVTQVILSQVNRPNRSIQAIGECIYSRRRSTEVIGLRCCVSTPRSISKHG
jgi:hypothetical protein